MLTRKNYQDNGNAIQPETACDCEEQLGGE